MALKLLKQQHYIIKGHSLLTSDLAMGYSEVLGRVGGQEVVWGDMEGETAGGYTRGYTLTDMLHLPCVDVKPEPLHTGELKFLVL